jgi:Zn-dependent protease with chaperone function
MLQQTALILVAGLIFLFFFTPSDTGSYAADPILNILSLIILTISPGLMAFIFGKISLKHLSSDKDRQIRQLRNSNRYALLFGIIALIFFVFEVYYLKLPIFIYRAFSFLKLENSRALIGLIPLIISVLLTRLATFELDRQVRNTSWTRTKFLSLNLKLMLLPVMPFLIYLLIGDAIEHSPISVRIFFITHAYIYWVIMFIIIFVMYMEAPFFLRNIWETRSLPDGEIRSRIELLAQRQNIKYRDALVWNTAGGKIANAGMAGLLPHSRYIFLTDALLRNFTADEIETIAAHEFGHIKYRHTLSYLVFSFGYLFFYVILYIRVLPLIEALELSSVSIAMLSALSTLLAFYIYFVFIFRSLSRKFERQADLYAVETTGKPEAFKSALLRLTAINYMPRRISHLAELFRTHPSVSRRLEFVDKITLGDRNVLKYRKPIFKPIRASLLLLPALLILFVVNRDSIFPADEIHYEAGRQYVMEGMIDQAIKEFKSAINADPESEQAHYALGILYARKGDVEAAIGALERTLRINPKNINARKKLDQILDTENEMEVTI